MRRIFHLSCAAQLGQLSSWATPLLDSYESGGIRVLSLKRLRCCSAGAAKTCLRCCTGGLFSSVKVDGKKKVKEITPWHLAMRQPTSLAL